MIISVLLGLVLVWGQMLTFTTAQGQECIHGEIRTVRHNMTDFIQFCVRGEWRLHCTGPGGNNALWRMKEATVACRQLGYNGVMVTTTGGPRAPNPGAANTTNFFRFAAQCMRGTENNVRECGGEVQELNKSCAKQHGIAMCQPVNCTNEEIRLMNGSSKNQGRVEVCLNGRWRTVCNNSQEGLAGAVCARVGFSPYRATVHSFAPRDAPTVNCAIQINGTNQLNCTTGPCDFLPSLGVVCKSFNETADDILKCEAERKQIIIESRSTINALNQTVTESRETINTLNATLGVVIGLLMVLLIIAVVGWIVTCIKLSRSSVPRSKITAGVHKNESYSLRQAVHDEATPTQEAYSSLGPNYDILNHGIQQAPPTVQPEPAGANKKENDFYNVEDRTYAVVVKKKAKKKKETGDQSEFYEDAESLKKVYEE